MSALFDNQPAEPGTAAAHVAVEASGEAAIAAGGNITQAFTGAGSVGLTVGAATLVSPEACPPAESVVCPPALTNLPSRAALFVGRELELATLDKASAAPGQAVVHVLHGLGGMGKSTLAARWAARRSESHAPVWWIPADSRAAIDAGLADLATALQPSLAALLPQEQLAEWALRWLASHTGWLLVLDDVSHPADVGPLLARATSGRFLITSRQSTGWRGIAEEVALDVLSDTEAADLFTRVRGTDPDTAELCAELGRLPLAVAQAAAYCAQTDCTVREYLDDLAAYPAEMYAAKDESGDHERTVARVWHVTLDRLADDPLTARILLTLAWYAPDGIPRTLLTSLGTRPAVRGALGRLAAHSMITLSGGDTVSVHRLVQAVSRTEDPTDRHRRPGAIARAREAAAEALEGAMPRGRLDALARPVMRALLPHVEELARHTSPEKDTAVMAGLLARAADCMFDQGISLAPRALALMRRAEAAFVRLLGPDTVQTLAVRCMLANAHKMLFDVEESAPVVERALADCVRVLGTDHPVTLSARMNAQQVAALADDTERALRLAEETLAGYLRVLGPHDPETLGARMAVAMAVAGTGELDRAVGLLGELVVDGVRVLGEEHPQTLSIKSVAAVIAGQAAVPVASGMMMRRMSAFVEGGEGLVALMREVVEEVASSEQPEVSPATEEDVAEAERTLESCSRVLGDEHADTFTARMALLQTYVAAEDDRHLESAQRLIDEMLSILGEDHPSVVMLLGWLEALVTVLEELPEAPGAEGSADAVTWKGN